MVTNATLTISCTDIAKAWFGASIATGAIARNTEAHNQVVDAMPALIAALGAGPRATPAASAADTVNTWFAERIATGPIAQHSDAYDQAVAALPALIAALGDSAAPTAPAADKEVEKAPPAPPATIKK